MIQSPKVRSDGALCCLSSNKLLIKLPAQQRPLNALFFTSLIFYPRIYDLRLTPIIPWLRKKKKNPHPLQIRAKVVSLSLSNSLSRSLTEEMKAGGGRLRNRTRKKKEEEGQNKEGVVGKVGAREVVIGRKMVAVETKAGGGG